MTVCLGAILIFSDLQTGLFLLIEIYSDMHQVKGYLQCESSVKLHEIIGMDLVITECFDYPTTETNSIANNAISQVRYLNN